nr:MAG TPA: hypothetical protein [Caudoviricetes sp.]
MEAVKRWQVAIEFKTIYARTYILCIMRSLMYIELKLSATRHPNSPTPYVACVSGGGR